VLAAVSAVLLALSVTGAPIVGAVPALWLGALITGAFAVSALAQYRSHRRHQHELPRELGENE